MPLPPTLFLPPKPYPPRRPLHPLALPPPSPLYLPTTSPNPHRAPASLLPSPAPSQTLPTADDQPPPACPCYLLPATAAPPPRAGLLLLQLLLRLPSPLHLPAPPHPVFSPPLIPLRPPSHPAFAASSLSPSPPCRRHPLFPPSLIFSSSPTSLSSCLYCHLSLPCTSLPPSPPPVFPLPLLLPLPIATQMANPEDSDLLSCSSGERSPLPSLAPLFPFIPSSKFLSRIPFSDRSPVSPYSSAPRIPFFDRSPVSPPIPPLLLESPSPCLYPMSLTPILPLASLLINSPLPYPSRHP